MKTPNPPIDRKDYAMGWWAGIEAYKEQERKKGKRKAVKAWGICWKYRKHCSNNAYGTIGGIFPTRSLARSWAKPHMKVVRLLITELPKEREK